MDGPLILPAAFLGSELLELPEGWPDGQRQQVMSGLGRHVEQAVVTVIVGNGTLSYRIDGGPRQTGLLPAQPWPPNGQSVRALGGFPPAAALRPWIRLRHEHDIARISRWYASESPCFFN